MRELGDADGIGLDPPGDVVRGGLAFERGVHREDDLVDPARGDAADEAVDAQVLGPHAVERREAAAEDMEAPRKQPRAIERPEIGDFLDDAQRARIAARIGADRARINGVDIAADRACSPAVG